MTAKIALATTAFCVAMTMAHANPDGAKTMSPPMPPLIAPRPGILANQDDADDLPEPRPGQVMTTEITPDGKEHCIIFAAPPAPPGTIVAQFVRDPRERHFGVAIDLAQPVDEGEEALAKQVKKVLRRKKPDNPGRAKSFAPVLGRDYPFTEAGWNLSIKSARHIPRGWSATVWVFADTSHQGVIYAHHHIEVYRFEDGKLTLESDSTIPGWDPSRPVPSIRF